MGLISLLCQINGNGAQLNFSKEKLFLNIFTSLFSHIILFFYYLSPVLTAFVAGPIQKRPAARSNTALRVLAQGDGATLGQHKRGAGVPFWVGIPLV